MVDQVVPVAVVLGVEITVVPWVVQERKVKVSLVPLQHKVITVVAVVVRVKLVHGLIILRLNPMVVMVNHLTF
tara:strand:+ start:277 stop:495 length:219 start_codon:yes stop_codon:yes gene_type:complete